MKTKPPQRKTPVATAPATWFSIFALAFGFTIGAFGLLACILINLIAGLLAPSIFLGAVETILSFRVTGAMLWTLMKIVGGWLLGMLISASLIFWCGLKLWTSYKYQATIKLSAISLGVLGGTALSAIVFSVLYIKMGSLRL